MSSLTEHEKRAVRARKLAISRSNLSALDETQAIARAESAYIRAYVHVADPSAMQRQLDAAVLGGLRELDAVQALLARNAHTRALQVKVRVSSHVARFQRANGSLGSAQERVRNAQALACSLADQAHEIRKIREQASVEMSTLTGRAKKLARDQARAKAHRLAR